MQIVIYSIYLISIIFIIANIILIWFSYTSDNWCNTTGAVITKELKRNTYPTKQPSSEGPIVRCTYLIKIQYKYVLNEKEYQCSRINFSLIDKEYPDEIIANMTLADLITDNNVVVFYNKFFPYISKIQPGKTDVSLNILIIVLLSIIIIGTYYLTY